MPPKATPRRRKKISDDTIYSLHEFGVLVDSREIFLTSNLNDSIEDAEINHYAAATFIKNLQLLNSLNKNPILVHQITGGGSWEYSMGIFDAIKQSISDVNILIYSHAESMSSIIPQAAKKRIIMPNAYFFIHWGTTPISEDYPAVKASYKWGQKNIDLMLDVYVKRMRNGPFWKKKRTSNLKIKNWLKNKLDKEQEIYLSAEEAVSFGLVDGILGVSPFLYIDSLRENLK